MTTAPRARRAPARAIAPPRSFRARRWAAALLIALLPLIPAACGASVGRPPLETGAWLREELYFGTDIPGGGEVSDAEWARFVDEEIAPRFPRGFTVLDARGRWRHADGSVADEATRVIVIVRPADDRGSEDAIAELIEAYKGRFRQESVMRVTDRVDARF